MRARNVAVRGATGGHVDRAGVAIVARRRTAAWRIAGLAGFGDAIAAGRRAIAIAGGIAAGRAATVAVGAGGDRLVSTVEVAARGATGGDVDRAGVAIVARRRTAPRRIA